MLSLAVWKRAEMVDCSYFLHPARNFEKWVPKWICSVIGLKIHTGLKVGIRLLDLRAGSAGPPLRGGPPSVAWCRVLQAYTPASFWLLLLRPKVC